jgi:hypothetical protein
MICQFQVLKPFKKPGKQQHCQCYRDNPEVKAGPGKAIEQYNYEEIAAIGTKETVMYINSYHHFNKQ